MKQAPRVGVGGVVVRDGKVLLIRRGTPPLRGRWLIPGGSVEAGETLRQALLRELREETGVRARPQALLTVAERIIRTGGRLRYHFVIVDFLCRWLAGEPRAGSDALAARWVSPRALARYRLPPEALAVVRTGLRRARALDRPSGSGPRASQRRYSKA